MRLYCSDFERFPPTAQAVCAVIFLIAPIYGEETLKDEKPFTAHLVNGMWIVQGTLPKAWDGGTAYAEISKETGCILNVTHFK